MTSRGGKLAFTVLVGVIALVGGAVWYLGPIAPIATGYADKTVCSRHLVAERGIDDVLGDLPNDPLVPFLRVDADDPTALTATLLGWSMATSVANAMVGRLVADGRMTTTASGRSGARTTGDRSPWSTCWP